LRLCEVCNLYLNHLLNLLESLRYVIAMVSIIYHDSTSLHQFD